MPYRFTTPTVSYGPAGGHRLFSFFELDHGLTVIKLDGEFELIEYPSHDTLMEADAYWLGGHEHIVDDGTAQELIAAGFEDYLTEIE